MSRRIQLGRYMLVGGLGFLVDAGILQLLSVAMALPIFVSRLLSFSAACAVTWYCNSQFTFGMEPERAGKVTEYTRYVAVQTLGAATNLVIFFMLIGLYPELRANPILPLAAGASISVLVTFIGSQVFVYRK